MTWQTIITFRMIDFHVTCTWLTDNLHYNCLKLVHDFCINFTRLKYELEKTCTWLALDSKLFAHYLQNTFTLVTFTWLWHTCTWMTHKMHRTCAWLALDKLITCIQLAYDLHMTCKWLAYDLHMTCTWLAYDLQVTCTWLKCFNFISLTWCYKKVEKQTTTTTKQKRRD